MRERSLYPGLPSLLYAMPTLLLLIGRIFSLVICLGINYWETAPVVLKQVKTLNKEF